MENSSFGLIYYKINVFLRTLWLVNKLICIKFYMDISFDIQSAKKNKQKNFFFFILVWRVGPHFVFFPIYFSAVQYICIYTNYTMSSNRIWINIRRERLYYYIDKHVLLLYIIIYYIVLLYSQATAWFRAHSL